MRSTDYVSLGDVVRFHASHSPDAVATIYRGQATTYASLDRAANRVACALIKAGVEAGDRICILAKNSARFVECLFGASKAGAVLTPINWRLAAAEIDYILKDSRAKILFVDADLLAISRTCDSRHLTTRVILDDDVPGGIAFADWVGGGDAKDPGLALSAEDIVVQVYTSGTTGRPKGAMLSHSAFGKLCELDTPRTPPWFFMDSTATSLLVVPMFHIGGTEVALRPLFCGGTVIIHREFDPAAILRDIEAYQVTVLPLVPTALQLVIEHPDAEATDFSALRTVHYGASPIPLDLLTTGLRVLKCDFVQVYGLTETTGAVTSLSPGDHSPEGTPQMRSVGKPLPGFEIKVVGADGHEMPLRGVGEILIRSTSVMKGYWGLPEATAAAIDERNWFRSGDAGYLDEDGYLYIHDRVKDMIVSGAENIYPAEVENAIFGHPQVQEVAVIGVPDAKWGEAVKAVIVARPGEVINEAELLIWVRTRIAGFKAPRSIDLCSSLPRNASGKVLKTELRRPYWAGHARGVN